MSTQSFGRNNLYRLLVGLLSVALILWGCLVVLHPFIPAFLLAIIFTISTWPAFVWLKERLHGRRTLAATLVTFALALCFIVPLIFLGSSLAENFGLVYGQVVKPMLNDPGHAPLWLQDLPVVGSYAEGLWAEYITKGLQETESLRAVVAPKLISIGASIGQGAIDLALGVIITFFFLRHGAAVAQRTGRLLDKFVGSRAMSYLDVSKKTAMGVVYGVLGTALAQGGLAAIGYWIAGVPGAPFLGLITLMLSLLPIGPPLIWVPATFWLVAHDHMGSGIFLGIWGLVVISGVDNIVKPYFISLGSDLPLPLVLLGVFGGLLAFGFIGLFIGPTLLAIAYALIMEWSHSDIEDKGAVEAAT